MQPQRVRKRAHRSGFGKTGHTFEQDMTTGDHGNDHAVDQFFLTDNHLVDLLAYLVHGLRLGGDYAGVFLDIHKK